MESSANLEFGPCTICGANGKLCARCRLDYYCGKEHQKKDWGRHKAGCGAVELRQDAVLGRHLVATKDIPAGTTVLRESALVVVPNYREYGYVYCVGCCIRLPDRGWSPCRLCGWPVCGNPCSKRQEHRAECAAFKRANFRISKGEIESGKVVWNALGALKVHLACTDRPRLLDLQCDFPDYETDKEVVAAVKEIRSGWRKAARWLRDVAGLLWVPEQDLVDAAGRLDINAEITLSQSGPLKLLEDPNGRMVGAVYAGLCMMEHSCMPTTTTCETGENPFTKTRRQERFAVTSRLVRAGEHLSVDYLDDNPFSDKAERYERLRRWGMVCRCPRCMNPSECGLFLGSICCTKCSRPGKLRYVVEPYPFCNVWICQSCGPVAVDGSARQEEETLEALMQNGGCGRPELTKFIERYMWPRGTLHPTHRLILRAKQAIIQEITPLNIIDNKDVLTSWSATCRDLLGALDALGREQCTRRFNVLGALIVVLKFSLRADLALILKDNPRAVFAGTFGLGSITELAPRVQEIEQLIDLAERMMLPCERKSFRAAQRMELDMLLTMTGCKLEQLKKLTKSTS